ncbi:MAG TPA: NosD domain-containing protein [Solirubrobacteraceae bacterium]|nr:NosD domain-containing protein [Solirubrobacteraceae bacterium]
MSGELSGYGHTSPQCERAAYSTIQSAVDAAAPGGRIVVCPGTYEEGVVIEKPVELTGYWATIDATSSATGNGVQIVGPGGSNTTVTGFRIQNAKFEGILIGTPPVAPSQTEGKASASGQPVTNVTIAGNVVVEDDKGFGSASGQCFSTPEAPGDCGEAIHLVSVTDSTVAGNYVAHNAGGILLTDEFGPTSGNTIRDNNSNHNETDCGITLAGHSPAAFDAETGLPTGKAGVFDNLIEHNSSTDNGVLGQGAGILMGGGAPDAGVYGNRVIGNYAAGNGLAGITIHQHLVGDLNGNVLEHNEIGKNNLDGDFDFKAAKATETTGILVASGEPPSGLPPFLLPAAIKDTVIRDNTISYDKVGIWTLNLDPGTTTISGNVFGPEIVTPVSSH